MEIEVQKTPSLRGNREPQRGNREPQRGNREPRRGNREPQRGNREPQRGNREPQRGNREPQRGIPERRWGAQEAPPRGHPTSALPPGTRSAFICPMPAPQAILDLVARFSDHVEEEIKLVEAAA